MKETASHFGEIGSHLANNNSVATTEL
jgi:hypothetical protein